MHIWNGCIFLCSETPLPQPKSVATMLDHVYENFVSRSPQASKPPRWLLGIFAFREHKSKGDKWSSGSIKEKPVVGGGEGNRGEEKQLRMALLEIKLGEQKKLSEAHRNFSRNYKEHRVRRTGEKVMSCKWRAWTVLKTIEMAGQ